MGRQVARIERLVQEISELNRIESGDLVLEQQDIDLYDVIRELVHDMGAPVTVRGERTPTSVDIPRAQQIFTNLIDNAQKHGGGHIEVDVRPEAGWAVVRVSDEGEGIAHGELERIFHRFYRIDKSRSVPGTGLGLAITKHLVLLHGGTIRAFNREGRGTTFEVRLPATGTA
jgi:two-component system sensor histidine kinase MtrB